MAVSRVKWEHYCAEKGFTGQMRQVEAENRKLKRKLEKFEAMLDLQKKVSQLLGISLASSEENGDES